MPLRFRTVMIACLLPCAAGMAYGDTYNFDSQAVGAPSSFNGSLNSPLVIGNATFAGGELLLNEITAVDETGVYGTDGYVPGYADEITITFATGINSLSLAVTNNSPGTFYVSDNTGQYSSQSIGMNGDATFSLVGSGFTYVTITEGANQNSLFDFAIDNVVTGTVNGPTSATPEPGTAGLVLMGLGVVGGLMRRR